MKRIPLNTYLAFGLLFWGLPGVLVAGSSAAEYTVIVATLVWLLRYRARDRDATPGAGLSIRTSWILALFSVFYLAFDATLGRRLLQENMFLHGVGGAAHEVEQVIATMGMGGGFIGLLGVVLELLPFALIDVSRHAQRRERILLWSIAAALIFYETQSGRGFLLMSVFAIFLGGSSFGRGALSWRRLLFGGTSAFAAFAAASAVRGDFGGDLNPLFAGIAAPFFNLQLLLAGNCGHAPWYAFLFEFLKKFLPAFIFPKTIFSFNAEMSLCLNPLDPNLTNGVSVFTWLGEAYYYVPSLLTVILAGVVLGFMGHVVDRLIVKHQMYTCRLIAGFLCIFIPRSRIEDLFSFLIAQLILFLFIWPALCGLEGTFHRYFTVSIWRGEAEAPGKQFAG